MLPSQYPKADKQKLFFKEMYDSWYWYKCEIVRNYTDTMPEKIPIEENEEFKSIRNSVVKCASEIHTPTEQPDKKPI